MISSSAPGVVLRIVRRSLMLLLLLSSLGSLPAAAPVWLKLQAPEFVIYSDAPEKQVIECALRYSAFRRAFAELFLAPGHPLPPSSLLLFHKEKSFHAVTPPATEKNTKSVNFSCEVDGTPLSTFALAGDRDRALELTFEFETIWSLRRIGHFVPVWMSQGAGEVLSTVTLEKGKCLVGEDTGHSFDDSFEWPRFFEINESSKAYRESGEELSQFLGQAWGLMHWILLSEGDSRSRFEALEQHLRTTSALEAVTAVMQTPAAQLSKTIRRHPTRAREIAFPETAIQAAFRVSPAPEAEVLVLTANLLCATDRVAEGNAELDRARALSPDLALVKEAWARRMLRESRPRDAVQLYREAIDAGSRDFAAYYLSAANRLDDNMTNGTDRPGEGGLEALKAVVELHRALEFNPGNLECFRLLGRAYYVAPDCGQPQLDELAEAATAGTPGQVVRYYRALLCARLQRREECAADFRTILADADISPQLRRAAGQQFVHSLLSLDAARVEKLARAQDYAAAFAVLAAGEKEPELAGAYGRLRAWLVQAVRRDPGATPAERQLAGIVD